MDNKENIKLAYRIFQNRKLSTEELTQIIRLNKLVNKYSEEDAVEVEDKFFKKYGCENEIDKIKFESSYIRALLLTKKDKFIDNEYYEDDLEIVNAIINSIDDVKITDKERIGKIKKALISIELDLNIGINFVSEIKDIYDMKMYKLEEENKRSL